MLEVLSCPEEMEQDPSVKDQGQVEDWDVVVAGAGWGEHEVEQDPAATVSALVVARGFPIRSRHPAMTSAALNAERRWSGDR